MLLIDKVSNARVILALGSGGVGKTSTSIALACALARRGKKVALLSIDPAKRLASALGIPLGSDLKPVNAPGLIPANTGSLHAAMLDQKIVFDQLVAKFAATPKVAKAIYANRLYQAASTNLGGPLEYLALAKLAIVDESREYDVIVVDTPPDTHALDFLQRPNLLSGFVENKVMSWMLKPFLMARKFGLTKLLSAGEKLMGSIASITGVKALESLAEFLVLIQDVIDGFHGSGQRVVQMLHNKETAFFIIGAPSSASLRSLIAMKEELKSMEYKVSGVVINRLLPKDVRTVLVGDLRAEKAQKLVRVLDLSDVLKRRSLAEMNMLKDLAASFAEFPDPPAIFEIPELSEDMQSIHGLIEFIKVVETSRT